MELGAEITGIIPALITVYFVEVGLVLVVAPWTTFWDRNYFVESFPFLETILTSHVVRGGVTGVGACQPGRGARRRGVRDSVARGTVAVAGATG